MKPLLRARVAAVLSIVSMVLVVLAPPGRSAAASSSSLTVSPGVYVGGQRLTFSGNLGVIGERSIHLQSHMGRPGDAWTDVAGSAFRTRSDGSFRFHFPAPSMFNIRMRVVSGSWVTPAWTFNAKSQELTLDLVGARSQNDNQVLVGLPFIIAVDTTPDLGRPDLPPPAFPGRTLTLQERVSGRWQSIATTTTDDKGNGSFVHTAFETGTHTYRVREEDWTADGNKIGWFPSFPFEVEVLGLLPRLNRRATESTTIEPTPLSARTGATTTAASSHKWGAALWDFAWQYGESLTSKPARGTDPVGYWLDTSNGSGRAAPHNGQLTLDSQLNWSGTGDHGTPAVTLHGNPMKYGRWEAKMRLVRTETGAQNYRARIELVPELASDYHCGAQNILVADVPVYGSTVGIGVKTRAGRQWSASKAITIGQGATNFAVEVSPRHISWFVNGRVVGTVMSQTAVSDVPMTLRLSLVGSGQHEMNHTQFHSDWQRGYSLMRGALTTSGTRLRSASYGGGC